MISAHFNCRVGVVVFLASEGGAEINVCLNLKTDIFDVDLIGLIFAAERLLLESNVM